MADDNETPDAPSLDEPMPTRRRASSGTAKLGADAQEAIRLERIESAIDALATQIRECRADMRTVIKALEGRTKVTEKCLALGHKLAEGLISPSRGTVMLAAMLLVAVLAVVAPSIVIASIPELGQAIRASVGTPTEAAP